MSITDLKKDMVVVRVVVPCGLITIEHQEWSQHEQRAVAKVIHFCTADGPCSVISEEREPITDLVFQQILSSENGIVPADRSFRILKSFYPERRMEGAEDIHPAHIPDRVYRKMTHGS